MERNTGNLMISKDKKNVHTQVTVTARVSFVYTCTSMFHLRLFDPPPQSKGTIILKRVWVKYGEPWFHDHKLNKSKFKIPLACKYLHKYFSDKLNHIKI